MTKYTNHPLDKIDFPKVFLVSGINALHIKSATLRTLRIVYTLHHSLSPLLVIKAPNISYFHLHHNVTKREINLSSLVAANVTIHVEKYMNQDATLQLLGGLSGASNGDDSFESHTSIPMSLSLCLETVELLAFGGTKEEIELVKYFLKVAVVLKKMQIFMKHRCLFLREKLYEQLSHLWHQYDGDNEHTDVI
ncbi:hypothetical protein Cgig2_005859 [Carnegiea gigantea]|uniref:FBD domain-containing protein n=1 Tax=Carnegiea gigantea TaxID=171969 RepID=A0A9Q1KP35_9CARY|nr:hypothetical protein Cgig2_005859 [Carnegiea gigantea]